MLPDLCTWIYDYAMSWLPPLPGFGSAGDDEEHNEGDPAIAPGTADALARAREALQEIERDGGTSRHDGRRLDARFRAPASILAAGGGVERLVLRLNEVNVAGLPHGDREALLGAAAGLVHRLRE